MESFVVRRSAWRMWGVSLLGVPMVVVALDLLTQRRLTTLLRDIVFRPDDTQLPEPRETVWAVALLVAGLVVCLWGLKELLSPSRVIEGDALGLRLKILGPLRGPLVVPWDQIADIGSGTVDDDGEHLPVLWVRSTEPGVFPSDAWGARPIDDQTLALLSSDWEISHVAAAEGISRVILFLREHQPVVETSEVGAVPTVDEEPAEPVDVPFEPDQLDS